jgi:hypothetical protein
MCRGGGAVAQVRELQAENARLGKYVRLLVLGTGNGGSDLTSSTPVGSGQGQVGVEAASSTSNVNDSGRMKVDPGGAAPPLLEVSTVDDFLLECSGFRRAPPSLEVFNTEALLQRGQELGLAPPLWDAPSGEALLEQAAELGQASFFSGFDLTSSTGADSGQVGLVAESSTSNVENSGPGRMEMNTIIEDGDALFQKEPPTPSIGVLLVQGRSLIPKPADEDEESDWSDLEVNILDVRKRGHY